MWFNEVFPSKFWLITSSVSGDCMHFIFKICWTVTGIRMICQFHEFFNLVFDGSLACDLIYINAVIPVIDALHIQNLSNCCRHKDDLSISRIFQSSFFSCFCHLTLHFVEKFRQNVSFKLRPLRFIVLFVANFIWQY